MKYYNLANYSPEEREKLMNGPALTPPPGVVPNFDPPNWHAQSIILNVVCLGLTLLVVGLRAYTKFFREKRLRFVDYLIALALLNFMGCVACDFWMTNEGYVFVHQWDIRLNRLTRIMFILHIGANLCAVTIMILKAAILLDWIHVFVPFTRNYFFWTAYIILGLHTMFYVAWIILENLSCIPQSKIWDITVWQGRCVDVKLIYIPVAAINLLLDIVIFALPQTTIWNLQMSIKKKIGVGAVFAIGLVACVSAAIRLHVTIQFYKSDDVVYTESGMYLIALAEMTCLFLVLCLPTSHWIVKTMFSWCTRRKNIGEHNSSQYSLQRALANRPRPNANEPRQETMYSIDTIWGPTTEITAAADGSDDHTHEEITGILRTREFTTEVITNTAKDPSNVEGAQEGGHEKHQSSIL
ncbi:hypothetical protein F5Y09DRAFT_339667 [Xylaria sp. FL1042]|nr:hypothetical protein F5Y09DRAFT_339667 [Xylaria sp. FL1042]